jgi:arginine/lysine/ornithine decarboxylase
MAAFASTSPSYLILQSLDGLNAYLTGYRRRLLRFLHRVSGLKDALAAEGFTLYGDEPLKLTIITSASGITGADTAKFLRRRGIEAEYFDRDFITFMLTPEIGADGCRLLLAALRDLPRGEALPRTEDRFVLPERVMSIRDAFMAKKTTLPTKECIGRVAGDVCVSCPPAVSPVVCGERLDGKTVSYLIENGVGFCQVIT